MHKQGNLVPYTLSMLAGVVVCLVIASIANRNEAWDAELYYSGGIPVMSLVIFIISYSYPEKTWRWVLSMAAGQFISAVINGSSASLWPIALVFMTIMSIPQFIAAYLGAKLIKRKQKI